MAYGMNLVYHFAFLQAVAIVSIFIAYCHIFLLECCILLLNKKENLFFLCYSVNISVIFSIETALFPLNLSN